MIAHKVESGRDVILDGIVYKPDSEKLVYLPRVFATDEIVPLVEPVDETTASEKKIRGRKTLDEIPAVDMADSDIEEALNG